MANIHVVTERQGRVRHWVLDRFWLLVALADFLYFPFAIHFKMTLFVIFAGTWAILGGFLGIGICLWLAVKRVTTVELEEAGTIESFTIYTEDENCEEE